MGRKTTPPRSEADALLAEVWASPHDDLPRLVYADFIEERGYGERAEFIRLQIAREAAESVGEDVSDEAHRREEELLPIPRRDWPQPGAGEFDKYEFGGYFLRGFPAPVGELTAAQAARRPDARGSPRLWAAWAKQHGLTPLLRSRAVRDAQELRLTPSWGWKPADFAALAGPGRPDAATKLWLNYYADPTAAAEWAANLALERLRSLKLPACGAEVVAALARSPAAGRLAELDLTSVTFRPGELLSLSRTAAFGRLRVLRVGGQTADDSALPALLASSFGNKLRELHVTVHDWFWVFCRALASAPPPGLRVLRIASGRRAVTPDEMRLLASARLNGLRELHVHPVGQSPELGLLKAAFGDRLRPAHLWQFVRPG